MNPQTRLRRSIGVFITPLVTLCARVTHRPVLRPSTGSSTRTGLESLGAAGGKVRMAHRGPREGGEGRAGRMLLAALVAAAACTVCADELAERHHVLKRDGWERLNVYAETRNDECLPERGLKELIEERFAPTRITPIFKFWSDFSHNERFDRESFVEHYRDEPHFLHVDMGCYANVDDIIRVGHFSYVSATFYQYEPDTDHFRSWGLPEAHFTATSLIWPELKIFDRFTLADLLTYALADVLDLYLAANLGSWEAVIAHRGDYPREEVIARVIGEPLGAKRSPAWLRAKAEAEAEEARRQADAAAWVRAEQVGTAESYGAYASSYPRGRHVAEARRREAALREKAQHKAQRGERLARKWPRGKKLRDCEVCPEMVVVPAGKYRMGSPSHEEGRGVDEGPVHDVTIWEPFAVGIHEVTRDEFAHFVKETGRSTAKKCWTYENYKSKERSGRSWKKPGFKQDGNHPVVCVSWDDAKAYAGWLSRKTGEAYRLLSESEWEYAVRAGTSTARHWGAGESGQCRYANGADKKLKKRYSKWKWAIASCDDKHVHTSPVGTYQPPNGFGLHDMLGNVWEWVEDCWHESYEGAPTDRSAWTRGGDCSKRVQRGGSWFYPPRLLRSASRVRSAAGGRSGDLGFRIARTLTP